MVGRIEVGRNIWLDRARIDCCAGGDGFWRSEDFAMEVCGAGVGGVGVCGRVGITSPPSV